MPKIHCPNCNQPYDVEFDTIGKKVQCAVCEETFIAQLEDEVFRLTKTTEQQAHFSQPPQHQSQYLQSPPQYSQSSPQTFIPVTESDKSRDTFALLGFFLGCLGIHEFYIGNIGNGIATILANFICSPPLVILIVGIDLLRTTTDSQKLPLKGKDSTLPTVLGILMILGGILLFFITIPFYLASASSN